MICNFGSFEFIKGSLNMAHFVLTGKTYSFFKKYLSLVRLSFSKKRNEKLR